MPVDNQIKEQICIFNPEYRLKNDKTRVVLYYKEGEPPIKGSVSNFLDFQHPVFAILLSLFNGDKPFEKVIQEFCYITGMDRSAILPLASRLVENKDEVRIDFAGHTFFFPKNTLVPLKGLVNKQPVRYDPQEFLIPNQQLDFTTRRLNSPIDGNFILNNICVTRCVYCYTDQRTPFSCQIPLPRIREIIGEARDIKMRTLSLTGGELFTYKHWREMLKELVDNGFDPFVSTKYPLNPRKVKELKDTGVRRVQLSLDTIDKHEMQRMLRIGKKYHPLILQTLQELDRQGFEIRVNGQITSINQDSMKEYFDFLLRFENVRLIRVRPTGYTMYPKGADYKDLRPDREKLKQIRELAEELDKEHGHRTRLLYFDPPDKHAYVNNAQKKHEQFKQRYLCSGNFFAFHILNDGRVTICEELYHHPRFIIGDLMRQSISEVWHSSEALSLFRLSKDKISEQSACKSCGEFDRCHQEKSICWKLVLFAYGNDKWDYPDPRCHLAPQPENEFWQEAESEAEGNSG